MDTLAEYAIEDWLAWRTWVTPKPLEAKPVHRWYIFPHSFTSELVHALIEEWGLGPTDRILDPFAGAGTTLLAAKEQGIPASGYDISPLAVLAARTKTTSYDASRLADLWLSIQRGLDPAQWDGPSRDYPELIKKALPDGVLGAFDAVSRQIRCLLCADAERDFFYLALLTTLRQYSRAVATGGWLKWIEKGADVTSLPSTLSARVEGMLDDLTRQALPRGSKWRMEPADARRLPSRASTYSAVITSPPYPNRHDYTRVFGVELMFGFLDWEGTRQLRYQSFHSHPEARPARPDASRYAQPKALTDVVAQVREAGADGRIPPMLEGYFLDMYLCLREVCRVCRSGARVAFVVGNAQYGGIPILVDELTAEIGEQAGLICEKLRIVRYRGNSAQQMGRYGRHPSRESIVIFQKP